MSEKPREEMTEQELARYYEAHKDDMSLWEKKPRQIRSRRGDGPSTIFSFRLTGDELTRVAEAANAKDMTISDFIRKATMAAVEGHVSLESAAQWNEVREKVRELASAINRAAKS